MLGLLHARIWHKRLQPKVHEFSYNGFYLLFSLKNMDSLADVLPVNPKNARFKTCFLTKTHGARDGGDLLAWARQKLGDVDFDDIWLMTQPQIWGYEFNPVSFWFCMKAGKLQAVLAEVNNTFGSTYTYVLDGGLDDWVKAEKLLHVSPFFDVTGGYRFKFAVDSQNVSAQINYTSKDGKQLKTSVAGAVEPLTKLAFKAALRRYKWMTAKTVLYIHWQALRLWLKRVRFYGVLDNKF